MRIEGLDRFIEVVCTVSSKCKLIAQISGAYTGVQPSQISSSFNKGKMKTLSVQEIERIVEGLVEGIVQMKAVGFDGVQIHAAHGYLLSRFLSPYTNHRKDQYGGSVSNRVCIIREIVTKARRQVGNFPILIKINGTDNIPGGIDIKNFSSTALEIGNAGIDVIEISGGMEECLVRSESELGFRLVPIPEAHTRINRPEKESYFFPYAKNISLKIPVILVGGNRNIERLEKIIQTGKVDFISLCRPLISEPDLPERWREGQGDSNSNCISCNACLYSIHEPGSKNSGVVTCYLCSLCNILSLSPVIAWVACYIGKVEGFPFLT